MKFSKISWLILVVGILAIAAASLFMLYRQQLQEQQQLNNALATAQNALPKLASERTNLESTLAELEEKLAQATSQLETAKAAFPTTSVESIEVDQLLFSIADANALDIVILTSDEPSEDTVTVEVEEEDIEVEDVTYLVTSFTVEVRGEVADILSFINTVVTHSSFTTATVELANITVPEPLTETEKGEMTEEEIEEAGMPSASIDIAIYTYKGE